jgi:hypothetical protein
MEAIRSFETSMNVHRAGWPYMTEEGENLKSVTVSLRYQKYHYVFIIGVRHYAILGLA